MVGLTAEGPTVGSNEGRLTLKAIVSLSLACACAAPPSNSSLRKPAPPKASASRRFTLTMLSSHVSSANDACVGSAMPGRGDPKANSPSHVSSLEGEARRAVVQAGGFPPARRMDYMHVHI